MQWRRFYDLKGAHDAETTFEPDDEGTSVFLASSHDEGGVSSLVSFPTHVSGEIPAATGDGGVICDFYCHRARLIVELDGAQHYSDYGKSYDAWRSEKLEKDGCKVLRFSNGDIHERFYGVCVLIDRAVKERIKEMEE